MTDRLTATAIVRDIADGARTPTDIATETLAVIEAKEPDIQAFAYLDPALARAQAEALEGSQGPLKGVTVADKDMIATRDMPTGHNNARYEGVQTGVDAACVDTLRSAGAIIVGKSVTTEFAATQRGGKTRNPHDLTRTPGGSSSGSAASVAAGMVAIGLGTQTGGSTIRPASFNGIWGWKPTWNTISREGLKIYSVTCDTLGLYARDPADFTLLADVFDLDTADVPEALDGLKLGLVHPPAWDLVEAPMRAALAQAGETLAGQGADIGPLDLPETFATIDDTHATILAREGRVSFLNEARACPDTLNDEFMALVENRGGLTPEAVRAAYRHADVCRAALDDILSDYDAIIAPSALGEAPVGLAKTGDAAMNSLWTLLGVPVVSVPGFTGPNGMPLGISVITRRYDDRKALAIATMAGAAFAAVTKTQPPGAGNSLSAEALAG